MNTEISPSLQTVQSLCLSWRNPGSFWTLSEAGRGETLSLRHSVRDAELHDLTTDDLVELRTILEAAIQKRINATT